MRVGAGDMHVYCPRRPLLLRVRTGVSPDAEPHLHVARSLRQRRLEIVEYLPIIHGQDGSAQTVALGEQCGEIERVRRVAHVGDERMEPAVLVAQLHPLYLLGAPDELTRV